MKTLRKAFEATHKGMLVLLRERILILFKFVQSSVTFAQNYLIVLYSHKTAQHKHFPTIPESHLFPVGGQEVVTWLPRGHYCEAWELREIRAWQKCEHIFCG